MRSVLVALLLAAATAVASPAVLDRLNGHCVSVQDGAAITVVVAGQPERVKLLGVAAPPAWEPSFGVAAKHLTSSLVLDREVTIETNPKKRDAGGRLVAYVYLQDGTFVNATVIRRGDAFADLRGVDPDHAHVLNQAEAYARSRRLALWNLASQSPISGGGGGKGHAKGRKPPHRPTP